MTTDGDVDLDLYADVEGGEFSHEGGYEDNQNENGVELFDDVIVPSANNDFPDLNGNSSIGINKPLLDPPSMPSQNYPGKRVSCYVGNLTWWTTDQDLTDSINSIGISDLIEIKFYENKINGQSKG
jgi:cleavage and polyadenylation specificity factor subunit 6/7